MENQTNSGTPLPNGKCWPEDLTEDEEGGLDALADLFLCKIHVDEKRPTNADIIAAYQLALQDLILHQLQDMSENLRGIKKQVGLIINQNSP